MKNVIVEKRNRIGIVTVNRPNELNSMNSESIKELAIAFVELDLDDDVTRYGRVRAGGRMMRRR